MLVKVRSLIADGNYPEGLAAARQLALDLLAEGRRPAAARAMATAAEILCALNQPARARGFAQTALDLADGAGDRATAAAAQAILALTSMRSGDATRADSELDAALERAARDAPRETAAFVRLVGALLSLEKGQGSEAYALAVDARQAAEAAGAPHLAAQALWVLAVCEERSGNAARAAERLRQADAESETGGSADTSWRIQASLADVLQRLGRSAEADARRARAQKLLERLRARQNPGSRSPLGAPPAFAPSVPDTPDPPPKADASPEAAAASANPEPSNPEPVPQKAPASGVVEETAPSKPEVPALSKVEPTSGLGTFLEVIKMVNSELSLRKLIVTILDRMVQLCGALRGAVVAFESDSYRIELARGADRIELRRDALRLPTQVLNAVRDRNQPVAVNGSAGDAKRRESKGQAHDAVLCVPLRVKQRLVGAVCLERPDSAPFGAREIEIAEILTDHAAVAIDNALLQIRASHDGLTQLINHSHFEHRLESEIARCQRHKRVCSLLMVDIDDFKPINDRFGHEVGNKVIRGVSRLIGRAVRSVDVVGRVPGPEQAPVVARYGGDEFELLLPETGEAGARRVAERILEAVGEAVFHGGDAEIRVSVSIGGASFPEDASDCRQLIIHADEALYAAKRAGKGRYMGFSMVGVAST